MFSNRSKRSWLRIILALVIVIGLSGSSGLLIVAADLDARYLAGQLDEVFLGETRTVSSLRDYYALCLFRQTLVRFWSSVVGGDVGWIFSMLYQRSAGATVFVEVQQGIRQIATAILAACGILIWLTPASKLFPATNRGWVKIASDVALRLATVANWMWLIYLRGNFSFSSTSGTLPRLVLGLDGSQEFWLSLVLAGSELVVVGLFPVTLLFSKKREIALLLFVGLVLGWCLSLGFANYAARICPVCYDCGISPFR